MISLIQAVKIMGLRDDDCVALCHEHLGSAQFITIKNMKR